VPELPTSYEEIIKDELNVKEVEWSKKAKKVELNITIDSALKAEGQAREIIRHVQNARKKAGLSVDDRIILNLLTDEKELTKAISDYADQITKETLAVRLSKVEQSFKTSVRIDDKELIVSLQKR
jgi:isoleucyl-tRNA synthetase